MNQNLTRATGVQDDRPRGPRVRHRSFMPKFLGMCLLFIALFAFKSEASHYRYGNISYSFNSGKSVTFHISQSYRTTYFSGVVVGGTVTDNVAFNFGDGSSQTITLTVTSINSAEDYFNGEATITHTYAANQTYTASYTSSARFGSLVNNAGLGYSNFTTVTLGTAATTGGTIINSSPVATLAPIVNVAAAQTAATFQVPAGDPDAGQTLTYRLATAAEMGVSSSSPQPAGLSINSTTGLVTFNTVGKTVGQLYNAAFVITDSKGATTMVDFIIRMVQASTPPAFDYNVTPANGAVYNLQPGQNVSFTVKAQDFDAGDQVAAFNAVGLPPGSTFTATTAAPNNPVSYNFSWTPTSSQLGSRIVNFVAQDNTGNQTTTTVTIITSTNPVFDVPPTKALNSFYYVTTGVLHLDTIQAHAPDANVTLQITAATTFSGVTYSPAIPTTAGNTSSTVMNWTPTAAQWGTHTFNFTATDNSSHSTNHSYQLCANTAPAITSTIPATTTVQVGQPFTYNITVADQDIPYGDEEDYDFPAGLPSWLTLTKNSETSATLSGTPTAANIGNYSLNLVVEDSFHHSHPVVQQAFAVNVQCGTPATPIVTTAGGATAFCSGGGLALTTASVAGYTYQWANNNTAISGATSNTYTATAAGSYTVTVTNSCGNSATSAATAVTVNPVPNAVATPAAQPVCNGDAITTIALTGNISGTTYAWTTNNNTNVTGSANTSGSGNSISGTLSNSTNTQQSVVYTITPTAAGCSGTAITATATVNPTPTVNAVSSQTLCAGTTTAAIAFSGAVAGTTYNWTNNTPSIGLAASGTGNIAAFTAVNATNAPVTATFSVTPQYGYGDLGNYAYVSNFYSNTVSVVKLSTNTVVATIPVGAFPDGISVSPDGSKVYVAIAGAASVAVINTATNTVTSTIPVGGTPYTLVASLDGSKVYTADYSSGTVSVINTATNTVTNTITAGSTPIGIALTPDGSKVYVSNTNSTTITAISTASNAVVATITVGSNPGSLAVTPDGSKVYAIVGASGQVSVINTATDAVIATTTVGSNASAVSASPDGTKVYVSNSNNNSVSVISTATNTVTNTITGFSAPTGVSFKADGSKAYVVNNGSSTVSTVNTATNAITSTSGAVGSNPLSIGNFVGGGAGCTGAPATFTITVNPLPVVFNVTGTGTYCAGGTGTPVGLSGSTSGVNYQLKSGATNVGSPVAGTGSAITFGNQTTGTYTVVATNATTNCTSNMSGSATITTNPLPQGSLTANGPICAANNGQLTFTSTAGTGPFTIIYNDGVANRTATNVVSGTAFAPFTNPLSATTTYTLVSVQGVNCTRTSGFTGGTATITVKPTPNAVATPSSQAICNGTAITTIALSGSVSGTTYAWTRDNTANVTGIAASGSGNISGTLTNSATSAQQTIFTITPTAAGCTGPTTNDTVTVNPTPDVTQPASQTLCSGNATAAVTFTGLSTGTTYSWTNNTPGIGLAASGTGNIPSFTATNAGSTPLTATITVTPANGGGNANLITNGNFETGNLTGWTNTQSGGATGWNINNGTFAPSSGIGVMAPIAGSYDVVTNQGGGGLNLLSSPATLPATVSNAVLSWKDRLYNGAGAYVNPAQQFRVELLNSSMTVIATVFSTNPGDAVVQAGPNARSFNVTSTLAPYAGQQVYVRFAEQDANGFFNVYLDDVSLTVNSQCTGTAKTFTVTVNPTPTVQIITGGGSYCSGGTGVPVGLGGSQSGVTYQLQINGTNSGSPVAGTGSAMANAFPNQTAAGTYTVVATRTAGSCTANMTGSATVVVNPLPTVSIASTTNPACFGQSNGSITTTTTGGTPTYSYLWTPGNVGTPNLSNVPAGTYSVTVTDLNGCTAAASATLTQPAVLSGAMTGTFAVPSCPAYNIYLGYGAQYDTLSAPFSGGTAPYTYAWSGTGTSFQTTRRSVMPTATTTYTATVTDNHGCVANASYQVKVLDVHCGPAYVGRERNNTVMMCRANAYACVSPTQAAVYINAGDCLGPCAGSARQANPASHAFTGTISVYPNPAHSTVNVQLTGIGSSYKAYQVVDITGKLIAQQVLEEGSAAGNVDVIAVNVSNYVPGVYLIRVTGGDNTGAVARFVVE